jgi:hypothetical protein
MSDGAWIGLVIGGLAVLVAMLGILFWDGRKPADDQIGDPTELARWKEAVDSADLDFGLATTRAAAGKWAASAAAILGILSTVAIVAGPNDLATDVGGDAAVVAAACVLAAGGVAAIATLLAGLAEQGSPVTGVLTPGKLRALTRTRAKRAAQQIRLSRILTVAALLLIFTAAGVAWLSVLTGGEPTKPQLAIVSTNSASFCGVLSVSSDAAKSLQITVAGGQPITIPGGSRIKLIDACPQ